jgi:AcrR family transcriptional regulator
MFIENSQLESGRSGGPRQRGRPPGPTPQGEAARRRLFRIAIREITRRGYEAATLRAIASKAGVSAGLLYRYFPSKRAVVLTLYDELSSEYVTRAESMPPGLWRERFLFAVKTSLETLTPHRAALSGLVPLLVGDRDEGLFAPGTAFSRERVQRVFADVVSRASDASAAPAAASLARLLYLAHLLIVLWWLLDRSSGQRATAGLLGLLERALPFVAIGLRVPLAADLLVAADELVRDGLFGERVEQGAE